MNTTKLMSMLLACCLSTLALGQTMQSTTTIYFNTDEHSLLKPYQSDIDALVNERIKHNEFQITLHGHADHRGDEDYNEALSRRRCESVRRALMNHGVPAHVITMSHYGERENDRGKSLQENRKVDILVKEFTIKTTADLDAALSNGSVSTYSLDHGSDHFLVANNGSRVYVPNQAFITADGEPYTGSVKLEVTEALDFASWLGYGLSTNSGDKLLGSGGMIKISATDQNDQNLELAGGKQINVALPTSEWIKEMEMFTSDSGGNWAPTGQLPVDLNNLNMPPYPVMDYEGFVEPDPQISYSDLPRRPAAPMIPNKPHEPRRESYLTSVKWYHLDKSRRIRKMARDFEDAQHTYAQKLKHYDELMDKHREAVISYRKSLMDYSVKLRRWEDRVEREMRQWKKSDVYRKALAEHDSAAQAYRKAYDMEVMMWDNLYKCKSDSIGLELEKLGLQNSQLVGNYVFAVSDLAWVNCDRFMDIPRGQKRPIISRIDEDSDTRAVVLFTEIRSAIQMSKNKDGDLFAVGIPKNEEAYVLAYKVQDKKTMVSLKPLVPGRQQELSFEESSFAELKELLASLDE